MRYGKVVKHTALHAIAHNLADSLGSGCSLLTGCYEFDLFEDLKRSGVSELTIDLLAGSVEPAILSAQLVEAARQAPSSLAHLCERQQGDVGAFVGARARFWLDHTGARIDVTVADRRGRKTTIEYAGVPAARVSVLDELGRQRPKRPIAVPD